MSYKFTKKTIQESVPLDIDSPFMIFPQAKMIIEAVGTTPKVDPQALAFVRAVGELRDLVATALEPAGYMLRRDIVESTDSPQSREARIEYTRARDAVECLVSITATQYKDGAGGAAIVLLTPYCSGGMSPYPSMGYISHGGGGSYGINWNDAKFEDKLKSCLETIQKDLDAKAAICKAKMDERAKQIKKIMD